MSAVTATGFAIDQKVFNSWMTAYPDISTFSKSGSCDSIYPYPGISYSPSVFSLIAVQ